MTTREFCALTGEHHCDAPAHCRFFARPGSHPYMPEQRHTSESGTSIDPVFNYNIFTCRPWEDVDDSDDN